MHAAVKQSKSLKLMQLMKRKEWIGRGGVGDAVEEKEMQRLTKLAGEGANSPRAEEVWSWHANAKQPSAASHFIPARAFDLI